MNKLTLVVIILFVFTIGNLVLLWMYINSDKFEERIDQRIENIIQIELEKFSEEETLKAPLEVKGLDGKDGTNGLNGRNGSDGLSVKGEKGESVKGDPGEKGEVGEKGETGEQGVPGVDGENGRTPEFLQLGDTLLYRYVGDENWTPVPDL